MIFEVIHRYQLGIVDSVKFASNALYGSDREQELQISRGHAGMEWSHKIVGVNGPQQCYPTFLIDDEIGESF